MKIFRRIKARWIIFEKTRRITRMYRWLACDARMELRIRRLENKNKHDFAFYFFQRNFNRMKSLIDKWGYAKN